MRNNSAKQNASYWCLAFFQGPTGGDYFLYFCNRVVVHVAGMDIAPLDLIKIERFAKKLVSLADYRKELAVYLHNKMDSVAPNLATLIGDTVSSIIA